MFDTVFGLPTHILLVHGVVVLLPLSALLSVASVAWRPMRSWLPAVAVLDAGLVGVALLAKESGEKLEGRVAGGGQVPDLVEEHAEKGDLLYLFALGLLVTVLIAWYAVRRGPGILVPISLALVVAAAVATASWTVVVGHSGSRAVWKGVVDSTSP